MTLINVPVTERLAVELRSVRAGIRNPTCCMQGERLNRFNRLHAPPPRLSVDLRTALDTALDASKDVTGYDLLCKIIMYNKFYHMILFPCLFSFCTSLSFALIIQAYSNGSRTFKIDGRTCTCDIIVSRPKCVHSNAKITAPNIERTFLSPLSRIFRSAIESD